MTADLNDLSIEQLGKLFPVILNEHDPEWIKLYLSEKLSLEALLSHSLISIEHIGSTAIPGLSAKPTIDILIQVEDDTDIHDLIRSLKQTGYQPIPKPGNPPPHLMLAKGYSTEGLTGQTYHLHLRYKGDWDEIVFRDYLIAHPATARDYEQLKRKLAKASRCNREVYTENKTGFIEDIVKKAREKLKNKF